MKLKDLHKIELPREKFEKYGPQKMRDYELLAILLGSGIKGLNVLELSKKILVVIKRKGFKKITLPDFLEIKGLGKAKAVQIFAALEFGNRHNSENKFEIVTPENIWNFCSDIRDLKKEHFVAIYLDTQNHVIEKEIISIGTLNASLVHPREVFEPALKLSAASIIVAHNHPSGSLEPSPEDREVTKRLYESASLLGIEFLDHVILGKKGFFSFKQKNLI